MTEEELGFPEEAPPRRRVGRLVALIGAATVLVAGGVVVLVGGDEPARSLVASRGGADDGTTTSTALHQVLFDDEVETTDPPLPTPPSVTTTSIRVPKPTIPKPIRDLVPTTITVPVPLPAATSTSTTAAPACPTPPPPWSVAEEGVYTVPTAGGPGRRILPYPHGAGEPQEIRYSPDGRHLALTRLTGRTDGSPEFTTLHLANADGTGERELVPSTRSPNHISWSPDGTRLALRDSNPDGALTTFVLDVRTESLTRLADHGWSVGPPHWSPDGRRIAWAGISQPGGVYVADVATGVTTRIDEGDTQSVDWSPDGTELAVARYGGMGGPKSVDVMRVDGSAKRTVHAGAIALAWSPVDRAHLVTDTGGALHLTDPDGGGSRFLASGFSPLWLPTGTEIAASSAEGVHLVDLKGCRRTILARGEGHLAVRAASPDGTEVLFVRFR